MTGGTAISRFHYGHRYSDDLDLFLNRSEHFQQEADNVIALMQEEFSEVVVSNVFEAFVRIFVKEGDTELKIEMINDVGYHFDGFISNAIYHKIDNSRNILSNKLSALGRNAAKDVSDIIAICTHLGFNWPDVFAEAQMKDTWANELSSVQVIGQVNIDTLMKDVLWVSQPDAALLAAQLETIAKDIVRGEENSLFPTS